MKRTIVGVAAIILTGSSTFLVAQSTEAASTRTDPACIKAGLSVADCTITNKLTVGPVRTATKREALAVGARKPAGARCRSWSQIMGSTVWRERQGGKFCYTGHRVRVQKWGGYHRCDTGGYGIGWAVHEKHCQTYRKSYHGTTFVKNRELFETCFIARGLPLCFDRGMWANAWPSGKMTAHYDYFR